MRNKHNTTLDETTVDTTSAVFQAASQKTLDTIKAYLADFGLTQFTDGTGELTDSIDNIATHTEAILMMSKMPEKLVKSILSGYQGENKADGELGDGGGIDSMYDGHQIRLVYKLAEKWATGDRQVEIGMKYPVFSAKRFIRKFKLVKLETFIDKSYREPVSYDVFYSPSDGAMFSFYADETGTGNYAGAIFLSVNSAYRFLDWFLGNPKHYIKDLNIGHNGLGGISRKDYDALRPSLSPPPSLSVAFPAGVPTPVKTAFSFAAWAGN